MVCVDTDVLIDLLSRSVHRHQRAERLLTRLLLDGEVLATTRINVGELLVGAHRGRSPSHEIARIDELLSTLVVIEFGEAAAERFGILMADLLERGLPIGDMDALIASTALSHGVAIVTGNARHFERVPGLEVVGY